jgi:hypothetical protein
VQKFFIAPVSVLRAALTQNFTLVARSFFHHAARRTRYRCHENPYFIVFSCNDDDGLARVVTCCAHERSPLASVVNARRHISQTARVHVSLSGNDVFFVVL